MSYPNFSHERELLAAGYQAIVGVDEAGAGALAGPLIAGAVILPLNSRLGELDDSKTKTPQARERLFDLICERATAWAVGEASVEEINTIGLRPANYLAMKRAVAQIPSADFVLVDAWTIPDLSLPQRGVIKGDHLIKSIAAASIVAKVTRDRMMHVLAKLHPAYGFAIHKGYGTKLHRDQIRTHGPSNVHRTSWEVFKTLS
ncbi:MAG: ribonuclease HII [Patescibacteria group bacterium]